MMSIVDTSYDRCGPSIFTALEMFLSAEPRNATSPQILGPNQRPRSTGRNSGLASQQNSQQELTKSQQSNNKK